MTSARPRIRPGRWMGLAAAAGLAAGLVVAAWQWRPALPGWWRAPESESGGAGGPGIVDRALDLAGDAADSVVAVRWLDEVPGIDLAAFDHATRSEFLRVANARPCTCGCDYSLAACRSFDPTCETSLPLLVVLRDSLLAGR